MVASFFVSKCYETLDMRHENDYFCNYRDRTRRLLTIETNMKQISELTMRNLSLTLIISLLLSITSLASEQGWIYLFDGKNLDGWEQLNGKAKYEVVDGMIVGTTVMNTPNSFLRTRETYGDFIFEVELLIENNMNSGVQFRSLSDPSYKNGRVHGYQCEVDPSARAWSGGIYDESRRGWLYPLTNNEKARSAFKLGEWNHYRIECIGNTLRTFVNGQPAAYLVDDMTAEGFIALQVHSIRDQSQEGKQIKWKNIRIKTENLKPTKAEDIFVVNLIPNQLSKAEKKQGWKLLFDGKTSNGWKSVKSDEFPKKGWTVENGELTVLSSGGKEENRGGDIITTEKFSAFDLQFEFKLKEAANSGIKYFTGNNGPSIGLEYQILDDEHPDAAKGVIGNRTVGSLYDLIPARYDRRFVKNVGEWNLGRLVVYPDNKVEHWVNGFKVVEYERGSAIFDALVARSKYARYENFAMAEESPILIQDHNDEVHFRSIKIKDLSKKEEAGIKLGIASYSLREFSLEETLAMANKLGIDRIALKAFHLPLDASDKEIKAAIQKSKDAGVEVYGGGVIYMKSQKEVDHAFKYAEKAGMEMIIGVPTHELLPYVEEKVKKYDIRLAIHNHGPGDKLYPSAESAYELIKDMDCRMGLCIDIGHTKRINRSPSQDLNDFFDRVFDIHIKDVTKAAHDGRTCEVGRGVIDIPQFLKDVIDSGYSGTVALEYEKDGKDPLPGMAESFGYIRGVLKTFEK